MIPFFEAAGNLVLHEMNTFWHNISWNPIYLILVVFDTAMRFPQILDHSLLTLY